MGEFRTILEETQYYILKKLYELHLEIPTVYILGRLETAPEGKGTLNGIGATIPWTELKIIELLKFFLFTNWCTIELL